MHLTWKCTKNPPRGSEDHPPSHRLLISCRKHWGRCMWDINKLKWVHGDTEWLLVVVIFSEPPSLKVWPLLCMFLAKIKLCSTLSTCTSQHLTERTVDLTDHYSLDQLPSCGRRGICACQLAKLCACVCVLLMETQSAECQHWNHRASFQGNNSLLVTHTHTQVASHQSCGKCRWGRGQLLFARRSTFQLFYFKSAKFSWHQFR